MFLWSVVESGTLGIRPLEGGRTMRMVYVIYQRVAEGLQLDGSAARS